MRVARVAQVVGTSVSLWAVLGMNGSRNYYWLAPAVFGASLEALGALVTKAAPKKDWAPTVFDGDALVTDLSRCTYWLSNASQAGEIAGPFLGALAVATLGAARGASLMGAAAVLSEFPAQLLLEALYSRNVALQSRRSVDKSVSIDKPSKSAWAVWFWQPSGTSVLTLSFSLLFFTALAPHGAVLTAFLATRNVDPYSISAFRASVLIDCVNHHRIGALAGVFGIWAFGVASGVTADQGTPIAGAQAAGKVQAVRVASARLFFTLQEASRRAPWFFRR